MARAKLDFNSNDRSFTSAKKTELLNADINDVSFTHLYWDIASVGSTSRELLVYGKTHHELVYPKVEDWLQGKVPTVFSVMPILTIKGRPSSSLKGQELSLAEASVIDMYLARRFGLLGDNEWESLAIQSFYSNTHYLRERGAASTMAHPPEMRKKGRDRFLDGQFRRFCEDHEHHLKQNGSNGHYVGNKKYTSIWKVKETVEKVPEIAEWRRSEMFKELEQGSFDWYSKHAVPEEEP
ncbi:hypothetical protein BGX33_011947 [Mortierella sp. NVP41]|nr:hypothetical protein BGX33_011947 [Mortierella sp. NVP41]